MVALDINFVIKYLKLWSWKTCLRSKNTFIYPHSYVYRQLELETPAYVSLHITPIHHHKQMNTKPCRILYLIYFFTFASVRLVKNDGK